MHGMMLQYAGENYDSRMISPVTLNRDWSTLGRLVFMVICASMGSIINGFFVASFFVEHTLKRIGYVFLACVGVADMIISSGVMPISAVVLLSGQWDIVPVCHILQFLTAASTYCYSVFFALVAGEDYFRISCSTAAYDMYLNMRIGLVTIFVFVIGFTVAAVGTFLDYDYDYCERLHYGNVHFRSVTFVIFHAIPFIFTLYGLIATSIGISRRARRNLNYRRSRQYGRDFSINTLNITAYLFYVVAWIPYLVVVHAYPVTSDNNYYHCAWIAISRSLITSFLYSSMNRSFRRAFAHLFYYCFCKSSMQRSFNGRHRRGFGNRSAKKVRVHIMHQVVTVSTPRGAAAICETQEL